MVEEISGFTPIAPTKQEPTNTNPPRETELESTTTTTSGGDTVSISREAIELLAEEGRTEALVEEDRVEELRVEESAQKAVRLKAEFERLQETTDDELAETAETENNESTRA